jgi:hypothetical protein
MDIRAALSEQYRAALAMLDDCVVRCSVQLWTTPNPAWDDGDRIIYRPFWRIAFHATFYTQLYLGQTEDDFVPWPGCPDGYFQELWGKPWKVEPMELPEDAPPLSQAQIREYIDYVDGLIEPTVAKLDLDTQESGFPWYRNISKLSHELLNLRHLQGHVGQLSELLFAAGVDSRWISKLR